MPDRLLLLIPTTSYRTHDFMAAAHKLGVEVVVGSNRRQALEAYSQGKIVTLNFRNSDRGLAQILDYHQKYPLQAIISVDEETTILAAQAAQTLGFSHNPPEAVEATGNKYQLRQALQQAGLNCPTHWLFPIAGDTSAYSQQVTYPLVIKPLTLSASQGVIRVDNETDFILSFERIVQILKIDDLPNNNLLAEAFIPGKEVALEGLLIKGKLQVLAIFDKPDPLNGPYFEETIYVTPSRHPDPIQQMVTDTVSAATQALGLKEGPIHAEVRINEQGAWLIDLAARSIGGLCARTLRFGMGLSLEEIIIHHALGYPLVLGREKQAAGVMMIPIPQQGILKEINGLEQARLIDGVEQVNITIPIGQNVVPLPEGNQYLGFIFARANNSEQVETALRQAHRILKFNVHIIRPAKI